MTTAPLPPHDLQLEENVLGSMLLGDGGEHIGFSELTKNDFYYPAHQKIFSAICGLIKRNQPVEILSVKTACDENYKFHPEFNVAAELAQLMSKVASSVNIEHHIENLKKFSFRRLAIRQCDQLRQAALDPMQEMAALNQIAQEHLTNIVQEHVGQGFQHISSPLKEVLDELEKQVAPERVMTGFWDIDNLEGMYRPGSYNIIAGLPGTGKTSFCLNIALNLLKEDKAVAFMSLDDSATNTTRRLISLHAEEELTYDGEKSERICETALRFHEYPLYIESTIQTIDELAANCRLVHAQHKPKLYVVDYLQLIRTDGREDDVQRISRVSRALRALSKQLDTAFIVTSQFSREGAKDRKRPRIHHLKGSSQIEQDADSIIIMHRADDQPEDWVKTVDVEFYVDKNKNGPVKHFKLQFQMDIYKFKEGFTGSKWGN